MTYVYPFDGGGIIQSYIGASVGQHFGVVAVYL